MKKIRAGVRSSDLDKVKFRPVRTDDIKIDFDYKSVRIMFLESQADKLDEVLDEIAQTDKVYLAPREDFEKFTQVVRELSKREDIRSIASILDRMVEIVKEDLDSRVDDEEQGQ